jgi:hypothetical protein
MTAETLRHIPDRPSAFAGRNMPKKQTVATNARKPLRSGASLKPTVPPRFCQKAAATAIAYASG